MADGHAIFAIIIAILAVIVFMLYFIIRSKLNKINKGKVYTILYFSILVILLVALVIPLVGFIIQKSKLEEARDICCEENDNTFREATIPILLSSKAKLMKGSDFERFQLDIESKLENPAYEVVQYVKRGTGFLAFDDQDSVLQSEIGISLKKAGLFEKNIERLIRLSKPNSECNEKLTENKDLFKIKDTLDLIKPLLEAVGQKIANTTIKFDSIDINVQATKNEYLAKAKKAIDKIKFNVAALENRFNESLVRVNQTMPNEIPRFIWVDFTTVLFYASFVIFVIISLFHIVVVVMPRYLSKRKKSTETAKGDTSKGSPAATTPGETGRAIAGGTQESTAGGTQGSTAGGTPGSTDGGTSAGTPDDNSGINVEAQTPLETSSSAAATRLLISRCLNILALIIICAIFSGISFSGLLQSIEVCSKSAKTSLLSSYTIKFMNTESQIVTKSISSSCGSPTDRFLQSMDIGNVESVIETLHLNEYRAQMSNLIISGGVTKIDITQQMTYQLGKIRRLVNVLGELATLKCFDDSDMEDFLEYQRQSEKVVQNWNQYADLRREFNGNVTQIESILRVFLDNSFRDVKTQIAHSMTMTKENVDDANVLCKTLVESKNICSSSETTNVSFWSCCLFGLCFSTILIQLLPSPWVQEKGSTKCEMMQKVIAAFDCCCCCRKKDDKCTPEPKSKTTPPSLTIQVEEYVEPHPEIVPKRDKKNRITNYDELETIKFEKNFRDWVGLTSSEEGDPEKVKSEKKRIHRRIDQLLAYIEHKKKEKKRAEREREKAEQARIEQEEEEKRRKKEEGCCYLQ